VSGHGVHDVLFQDGKTRSISEDWLFPVHPEEVQQKKACKVLKT
jgi:hypothetical protein